jgi:hypothetical protein
MDVTRMQGEIACDDLISDFLAHGRIIPVAVHLSQTVPPHNGRGESYIRSFKLAQAADRGRTIFFNYHPLQASWMEVAYVQLWETQASEAEFRRSIAPLDRELFPIISAFPPDLKDHPAAPPNAESQPCYGIIPHRKGKTGYRLDILLYATPQIWQPQAEALGRIEEIMRSRVDGA